MQDSEISVSCIFILLAIYFVTASFVMDLLNILNNVKKFLKSKNYID